MVSQRKDVQNNGRLFSCFSEAGPNRAFCDGKKWFGGAKLSYYERRRRSSYPVFGASNNSQKTRMRVFLRYNEVMKPRLFFITGISGSGKTTIGRKLEQLGEVAFDSKIQKGLFHFADQAGNQPKDYQPNNSDWMEKYHWVLNKPMFDDLMAQNSTAKRVFLCGGAVDVIQYWVLGEKVFLLKVDSQTMLSRLKEEKRDNDFGKDKETQERLLEKLNRYQDKMTALGAIPIDGTKSVDEIVKVILSQAT